MAKTAAKKVATKKVVKHSDLLKCRGYRFTAIIQGRKAEGVINVEENRVYLCQNVIEGTRCDDTLGFSHSWVVDKGTSQDLRNNEVKGFKLGTKLAASEIPPVSSTKVFGYKTVRKGNTLVFGCGAVTVYVKHVETLAAYMPTMKKEKAEKTVMLRKQAAELTALQTKHRAELKALIGKKPVAVTRIEEVLYQRGLELEDLTMKEVKNMLALPILK